MTLSKKAYNVGATEVLLQYFLRLFMPFSGGHDNTMFVDLSSLPSTILDKVVQAICIILFFSFHIYFEIPPEQWKGMWFSVECHGLSLRHT